jgi:hypothetical protein
VRQGQATEEKCALAKDKKVRGMSETRTGNRGKACTN